MLLPYSVEYKGHLADTIQYVLTSGMLGRTKGEVGALVAALGA